MNMRAEVITDGRTACAVIEDGMTIAVGGFINASHPMSLLREVMKGGARNLTVVGAPSAGLEVDMLIAAGVVERVICPYIGAEGVASVGPAFKRAAEQGTISLWECDEWIYYAALRAGAMDLPYLPCRGLVGTSYPDVNPDLVLYTSPVGGEQLIAVPAIRPDVALLHAARSDPYGNVQYADTGFGDRALYNASARTIVQVETVVPVEATRAAPSATAIPYADAIVHAPFGAHPFSSAGYYTEDSAHLVEYVEAVRQTPDGGAAEYLDTYVHGPVDHLDYLERVGLRRLLSLSEYP
jgi:glutaconate CoA-transferase subunit A